MASTANYGLKALITSCRFCATPDCDCKHDMELVAKRVNLALDPSHKLEEADLRPICLDLDEHPLSDRPDSSGSDEKQRDDGNFDRVVEEAFKAFRDQERDIILNAPAGLQIGSGERHLPTNDSTGDGEWWVGAAHLRHYLEFLLVLKGLKPCMMLVKFSLDNVWIFSTLVIDCLVPIMDRLGLWSYGYSISFQAGEWVFYDTRSPVLPSIDKVFLTHRTTKNLDPVAYPEDSHLGAPEPEVAVALGYPIAMKDPRVGHTIHVRDTTEMDVLVSRGWPEPQCCVQGTGFNCPAGNELIWVKVLDWYYRCERAARSVGTELQLFTGSHPEMSNWLADITGMLEGPAPYLGRSGPKLNQIMEMVEGSFLARLMLGEPLTEDDLQQQDEDVEVEADHN
ncbi:hypothetical protein INS49_003264 [Diaporthe citri]|uniref:uncharacterized protein n=1 Tax=Diaporthe citri TaxID=83186 RepID=UPI001C7F5E78|nr:uncharacterized protein INS49_003264 [Diaporthe citri]KAG6355303.1 hypothetical protein INS49_003264 [Diaporthe citri]